MDHGNFIRDLGGASVVGSELREAGIDVKDVTVRSWCLAGRAIPDGYWVHIKAIADAKGVPCSFESLAASVAIQVDPAVQAAA